MEPSGQSSPGIMQSLRRAGSTFVGILHNRLSLFSIEFREETQWMAGALLWSAATIFCGVLSVLFLIATCCLLLPPRYRPLLLGACCILFLVGTVIAALRFRRQMEGRAPFSATLGELQKDLACLKDKAGS